MTALSKDTEVAPGPTAPPGEPIGVGPPNLSYRQLFFRFLRFGFLAWGGPVAQIAMIRQELVAEQHWITPAHFNRVLAVYQVLPGPEAHELCVYFGYLARGRLGGLLAGLGFMLPGFVLMLLVSWAYITVGLGSPFLAAAFAGCQVAVAALIVRAVHRIGEHALTNAWLWAIGVGAAIGQMFSVPFYLVLGGAALIGALVQRRRFRLAAICGIGLLACAVALVVLQPQVANTSQSESTGSMPSTVELFGSGLRAGLLTFGGAYTAIPFVQHDAVEVSGWMTNGQFLDGLALSGVLPAPLVIFVTFVGYLGGGLAGAFAMTSGMFLPAFLFTLVGHDLMERLVERPAIHAVLDSIAASVVGLITATTLQLLPTLLTDLPRIGLFLIAILVAFRWRSRWAVPAMMLGTAMLGLLALR